MWGGRFAKAPAELMAAINNSLPIDQRLLHEDIAGSIAHATMLGQVGIITDEEARTLCDGLAGIKADAIAGRLRFDDQAEDIHMAVEAALTERVGAVGGKLHTARSRNDQVATDFRLWLRTQCTAMHDKIKELQGVLLDHAEGHAHTVMPGFTHLQVAQPVSLAHHLLAYVHALGRDRTRFADAAKRMNECPLGAAALAGTPFPIDREATAAALGFDRPCGNAMDAVSARDFALETVSAAVIATTTLSRWAEEIVIWSNPRFGFVDLPDDWSTGSSIMPQKRNPDAAELIRAKPGVVLGSYVGLATIMKGLPMAYSKDLQEDKVTTFRAVDETTLAIDVMTAMTKSMTFSPDAMRDALEQGYPTATDLADHLVSAHGVPFRDAHAITGRIVRRAEAMRCALSQLPITEMQAEFPSITEAVRPKLDVTASMATRNSQGGTAPETTLNAIAAQRAQLSE
ncbi:MAG: argininosuccinate lyase [Alphaproteobacteria bacterium]|nr:argininosuccinate lyase [Alphaproteobacteria bacterium]